MSLSRYLQTEEVIRDAAGTGPSAFRTLILDRGGTYFRDHPEETEVIKRNLTALGLASDPDAIEAVKKHVLFHYYEKLLPLSCTPASYRQYLDEHVELDEALGKLAEMRQNGTAVLLAVCHFGAVELIGPALAAHRLPITAALRFQTTRFSEMVQKHARVFEESGHFGRINFIEVGKPKTAAALEMAAALRRGDLLTTVFDERTEYSIPVNLFGKKIWGGAGLDRLIRFAGVSVVVLTPFMVRTSDDTYKLTVRQAPLGHDNPIQAMYDNLQQTVEEHPAQWYFLHEEIPFVE